VNTVFSKFQEGFFIAIFFWGVKTCLIINEDGKHGAHLARHDHEKYLPAASRPNSPQTMNPDHTIGVGAPKR